MPRQRRKSIFPQHFTIGTYNTKWNKPRPKGELEVYEDEDGNWYWRLRARTGQVIAVGVGKFNSREECKSIQALFSVEMREADVVEVDGETEGQEP